MATDRASEAADLLNAVDRLGGLNQRRCLPCTCADVPGEPLGKKRALDSSEAPRDPIDSAGEPRVCVQTAHPHRLDMPTMYTG